MTIKPPHQSATERPKPGWKLRGADTRSIQTERPTRVWSLLLPPTLPRDRR